MSAFIDEQKELGNAVQLTCRTLVRTTASLGPGATGELSTRAVKDEQLLGEVQRVFKNNYECYGSLRTWQQLRREGVEVGRGRVEQLMRELGAITVFSPLLITRIPQVGSA